MASIGIGAKLRKERLSLGLSIDEIARETRIASRFLVAIEAEDFESLPSLVFTRNFVRQFAVRVNLDPDTLLVQLPKLDESMIRLPDPPARSRTSYGFDRRFKSALSFAVWLVAAAGAATAGWFHFSHPARQARVVSPAPVVEAARTQPPVQEAAVSQTERPAPTDRPVQVVITAHQPAWLQVSADGKTAFTGTLKADETRQVGADEQVKIVAGNAGALTISLNGKTLEPLGPVGQVRVVRLTAEGPEFLSKGPPPAPDPL